MERRATLTRLVIAFILSVSFSATIVISVSSFGISINIALITLIALALFLPFTYLSLKTVALSKTDLTIERLNRQVEQLNSTAMVSESDLNGAITYANQLFCEVSKFTLDELLGKNHNMVNSGYHDTAFWDDYWQTIKSGKVWRGEICNRAKDGSLYWVYAVASPIFDSTTEEIKGYSSVRVNITDTKLAEQKEAARRERIIQYNKTLASLIRHPMFIKQHYDELLLEITRIISNTLGVQRVSIWTLESDDEQHFIKLVNLWDLQQQEYVSDLSLFERDFPSYFAALFQDRVLIYDDVYQEEEVAEFTQEYFPTNNITSMLDAPFYQGGNLAGVICLEHVDTPRVWTLEEQSFVISLADILTIIYESKRLAEVEATLKHAEKMEALGKLTGGIAHDFNNMLGVIMGYSDMLVNTLDEGLPAHKYARQIQDASQRGAKLTTNLLSFSRKKEMYEQELNLAEFITEQQELIQKTLTVGIAIEYTIDNDLWPVWIDKSEMEHALLNMCINAMHAMENVESPTLKISLKTSHLDKNQSQAVGLMTGDYVLLEFIDNGCGISDEVLTNIFDPFYTTKGEKGTGLGLAQVMSFMNSCNGAVEVTSKQGDGAHFTLYFPRHYNQASLDLLVENDDLNKAELEGFETILVVDDELALCDLAAEILTGQGYKIIAKTSALEALDYLENNTVDAVLSDVVMPEMDGYVFASTVLSRLPAMKIQLMSGYAANKSNAMVNRELVDNMLRKPFQPHELLIKIRRLLDK